MILARSLLKTRDHWKTASPLSCAHTRPYHRKLNSRPPVSHRGSKLLDRWLKTHLSALHMKQLVSSINSHYNEKSFLSRKGIKTPGYCPLGWILFIYIIEVTSSYRYMVGIHGEIHKLQDLSFSIYQESLSRFLRKPISPCCV